MVESRPDFETLIGLVEQYSPSGSEKGAVDWLVARMRALGFTRAFVDRTGNAVGVMGAGRKQVVLLGHIDTVPGEIPVRVAPSLHGEGVVLYGRGSVDAKGPLAAFVDAVAETGAKEGIQYVVIAAIDEERDSIGARAVVDQYQPDFAIIGEPSGWDRVTLGYKGTAWAEIHLRRSMAHTAGQAESAPEAAVNFWNRVTEWTDAFNQGRERLFDQLLPTLRGFSSGGDGFEDSAVLKIGMRLPLDISPSEWYSQLRAFGADLDAEVRPTGFPVPAYRAERHNPLVRAFLGGIRESGGKPGFVVKTGTADLNIVGPAWRCPAIAYGPGDSNLDHTPDEHLPLWEYEKTVAVLVAVLGRLAGS